MNKAILAPVLVLALMVSQPGMAKPPGGGHDQKGVPSHGHAQQGPQKHGRLPPGWQKKLSKGARIDPDIYRYAVPLSRVEIGRLPPLPGGMIQVRIEDRIVRLHEGSLRVDTVLRLP